MTLRSIGRAVGVSHTALGKVFGGQRGLFEAAAIVIHGKLAEALAASQTTDDALENLRLMGRAYISFAHQHRGWMELLGHPSLAGPSDAKLEQAQRGSYQLLIDAVIRGQSSGQIRPADPSGIALTIWSAVHGFAALDTGFAISQALVDDRERWVDHMFDGIYIGMQPHWSPS